MDNTNESSDNNLNPKPDNSPKNSDRLKLNIEKKGLKEYLYEGMMIFLAVMLGFISENIRENFSEQNQAKEFATSMVADLKSDTTELKKYLDYMTYASDNIDTMLNLLSTKDLNNVSTGKLYWYGLWGGAQHPLIPNDATFQQMKSSGSLRYFTNISLAKKVAEYDLLWRRTMIYEEIDKNLYVEVRKARARIFEYKYNKEANMIYQGNKRSFSKQKINDFIESNPPLLTNNKAIFNQYLELVRSRYLRNNVSSANILLGHASALINDLKKTYNIN